MRFFYFCSIYCFLFLFHTTTAIGQENIFVQTKNKIVGRVVKDSKAIPATEAIFTGELKRVYYDDSSNCLLGIMNLPKAADAKSDDKIIFKYSIDQKKVVWQKTIDFSNNIVRLTGSTFMIQNAENCILLNENDGSELWKKDYYILYYNADCHIAFGYKFAKKISTTQYGEKPVKVNHKLQRTDSLDAFDITTDKIIWTRHIPRGYSSYQNFKVDDSNLVFFNSGLSSINIFNGKGWRYEQKTKYYKSIDNSASIGASIGVGILGALLGAVVVPIPTGSSSNEIFLTNLTSNLLQDDSCYYAASKDMLYCLYKNGTQKWFSLLPEKITSSSQIYFNDTSIVFVNKGHAEINGQKYLYGSPYIVSISRKNGAQIKFNSLDNKGKIILDNEFLDNQLVLKTNKGIYKFDALNTAEIAAYKFPKKEDYSTFLMLTTDSTYLCTKDQITLATKPSIMFFDNNNKYQFQDKKFTVISDTAKTDYLYKIDLYNPAINCFASDTAFVITNNTNKPIAELEKLKLVDVHKNWLYAIKNNSMYIIDMSVIKE